MPAVSALRDAARPLIVAGGGVLYAHATDALRSFAQMHGVPVAETQAGKGSLAWDHPLQQGSIGVTGSPAANALARDADVVLGIGTRLQDFTTGSHTMFAGARLVSVNVNRFDAHKWRGVALCADARTALPALSNALAGWRADAAWTRRAQQTANEWRDDVARITGQRDVERPYEGDVIGVVQRSAADSPSRDIVVCAAGTLPGRAAQAVANRDAGRLPHGVRLLVHGLRDRRRPRCQDRASRARSYRDARRRQLPDAELASSPRRCCSA